MLKNTDNIPDDLADRSRWPELYETEYEDDPEESAMADMEIHE